MLCSLLRLCLLLSLFLSVSAFAPLQPTRAVAQKLSPTAAFVFGKKKKDEEDLSYLEVRDMTREEMLELNKQNEDIMNAELIGMTLFSLILSVPMLYLVWVGFFSETAGDFDL